MASKYDVLIRDCIVVDGTGSPPFKADIGVCKDVIVKIGDLSGEKAEKIIKASGLIASPGFIDLHNHSDLSIFTLPTADNYVRQGVTTILVGNCGFSPAPLTDTNKELLLEARPLAREVEVTWNSFKEYLEALEGLRKSINVATLVGHGTIRSAVIGFEDRTPKPRELREMKELAAEALEAGAFGISSGLIYTPGVYAKTEELVELLKVARKYRGIYFTHMRNEGEGLIDSILEAVRIGLEANVPVEISHLKASGRPNWGKITAALKIIEDYADRGLDVTADAYPYTASSTSLSAILPPWVREGGVKKMLERIRDDRELEKIEKELKRGIMGGRRLEWNIITISRSESHPEVEGKSIEEIAKEWNLDEFKTAVKLLVEDEGSTGMIIHGMFEEDVIKAISHPYVAIGSDGSIKKFGEGKPHPRNYGTFPRVLARYVRELKVLTLPEAIRKMTSLPARKLKLWDRGVLRPGMKADLVLFNRYTVRDTATFQDPHKYPEGILYVLVNGVLVVDGEEHTRETPGKLLKNY